MIIAIDGPAASGKGTLGKRLAAHYGYRHLDTGLIYRAVAKAVLDAGRQLTDEASASGPPRITGSLVERARAVPDDQVIDWIGAYLDRARQLGMRTAELHLVLASEPNDPLLSPEPFEIMHQQSMYGSASGHLARTFELLRNRATRASPSSVTCVPFKLSLTSRCKLASRRRPSSLIWVPSSSRVVRFSAPRTWSRAASVMPV